MSKTIIWIRHGLKEYGNSKGPLGCYQHDSPLASNQEINIINKGKQLIEKYGIPELCISSPYKRTRDTANLLTKETNIPIEISNHVSEYLGNQKNNTLYIEPHTADYNPPLVENFKDLITRCSIHLSNIGVYDDVIKSNVIWVVTHGVVIKTISNQLNKIYRGAKLMEINELEAFIFTKNYYESQLSIYNNEGLTLQLAYMRTIWDKEIDDDN